MFQWCDNWCLVSNLCSCLPWILLSLVVLLIEFLNCAFSFNSLNKLFKSLSNSFLLYIFGVRIIFKFFVDFCYFFAKENYCRWTTFPYGSDWHLIDFSVFLIKDKVLIASSMNDISLIISIYSIWHRVFYWHVFLTFLTFLLDLLGDFGGYFLCWWLFQFFSFWFQYQNLLIFWLVAYIRFWFLCGRWSWSIPSDLFSLSDFFCWSFTILICIIIYAWFFVDIFLQALA